MIKLISTLIIGLGIGNLFAQEIDSFEIVHKKKLLYANLGVASSINYERTLIEHHKEYLNNLNVQVGGSNTLDLLGGGYIVGANIALQAVTGVKNNHLIFGGGLNFSDYSSSTWFRINMSNYDYAIENGLDPGEKPKRHEFGPSFRIGYRYQKPGGLFMFNTGISSEEIIFIGAGIAF